MAEKKKSLINLFFQGDDTNQLLLKSVNVEGAVVMCHFKFAVPLR